MCKAPLKYISALWHRNGGGHPNESRDCTVRALSLAADIEYKDAHVIMELAERRVLHGANMVQGLDVAEQLGMLQYRKIQLRPRRVIGFDGMFSNDGDALFTENDLRDPRAKLREGYQNTWAKGNCVYYSQPQRSITLSLLIKKLPKGRYIVCSHDHAFALIDGVVHDSAPVGLSTRVRLCYQIMEAQ